MTMTPWGGGDVAGNGSAPASVAAAPSAADLHLPTEFVGTRKGLFGLALRSSVMTVLTLGFYRFWMKTRLRRWYWSSIRPGGVPLEYTGDPIEKLLGFLMAVVILSFYIGIVNLILMFLSFSLLSNNFAAYLASLVGVIPLWFYAQYRARRYVLARTRWAGIRFGVDKGAWGYAGRALVHWSITILTLGLLWPRMTFALEKYKIDRTNFGTAEMVQGGRWQMLYRPFLAVVIPGALIGATSVAALIADDPTALLVQVVLVPWFGFAMLHYSVSAKRIMANHKTVGGVRLQSAARSGHVIGVYALGYFLTYLTILIPLILIGILFGVYLASVNGDMPDLGDLHGIGRGLLIAATVALYFAIFLSWSVLRHVFVTMPVWQHYAQTLSLTQARALSDIRQRAQDEMSEAEGFAEALDLGAAI